MADWTFITNHGAVLASIAEHGQITAREIAARLGITERSVHRIIADLEEAGYVVKERSSRTNRYQVNPGQGLRRPEASDIAVGDLLRILNPRLPAVERNEAASSV
jgi:DNA-binding IclR family transcriptional regulator